MIVFMRTILCLVLMQGTSHALALAPFFTHENAIDGEYLVFFKDNSNYVVEEFIESKKEALIEAGATIIGSMPNLTAIYASFHPDLLDTLRADPTVKFVEENAPIWVDDVKSWGLDRIDQRDLPLDQAFNPSTHGAGVHAFVVDTGIRATHQEFTGRIGISRDQIGDGIPMDQDCHGHGTHVAGTIGGSTVGVANQVTLHAVRVLDCQGSGSIGGALSGLDWIMNQSLKPAVVNMSLTSGASAAFNEATAKLVKAGFTAVVAAGNATQDACNYSPAAEPLAITVGATTNTDTIASFSNFGQCVDIFAPGQSIYSANGYGDTNYSHKNGTSMASPHVAGAVAIYLGNNPKANPEAVALALRQGATPNIINGLGQDSRNLLLFVGQGENLPPAADAGNDILLQGKTATRLDGSRSIDPEGQRLTFLWTQVSGPSQAVLTTPNAAKTQVNKLIAANEPYVFALTVTDREGQSQSDQVTVTINLQPIVKAGANIKTNARKILLTGQAHDPDGTVKSVVWAKAKGRNAVFSAKNALVTEVSGLRPGEYIFRLTAVDDRWGTASDRVRVIVQ